LQSLNEVRGVAEANVVLGSVYLRVENRRRAQTCASSALQQYESVNDEAGIALALALLGDIAREDERFAEAEGYYRRSFTKMEWGRDYWLIVATLINQATVLDELGRHGDAEQVRAQARRLIDPPKAQDTPRKHAPVPIVGHHSPLLRETVRVG